MLPCSRAGDVKQQALVGQMYAEGYGCKQDSKAAKEWTDRAANRGYRMSGEALALQTATACMAMRRWLACRACVLPATCHTTARRGRAGESRRAKWGRGHVKMHRLFVLCITTIYVVEKSNPHCHALQLG